VVSTLDRPSTLGKRGPNSGEPPGSEREPSDEGTQFKNELLILVSAPLITASNEPIENLAVQTEVDEIVQALEEIAEPPDLEVDVRVATVDVLNELFARRFRPTVIHFIGHGMFADDRSALVLEHKDGSARPFSQEEMAMLLRNRSSPLCQIALLNACHSQGLADSFLETGVQHVVAVDADDEVLDLTARIFSKNFYRYLFNKRTVQESFEFSQNAVLVDDDLKQLFNQTTFRQGLNLEEALKFRLYPRNSVQHKALEFQSKPQGDIRAPVWEKTNIAQDDLTFVGRRSELHRLNQLIADNRYRCVALHGFGGMGKTSLALALGRWQHERSYWRDGVWFVGLREVDTRAAAIARIYEVLDLGEAAPGAEDLQRRLSNKRALLVLDDVDRLKDKDADGLVEIVTVLQSCPKLKVLVTSRADLPGRINHIKQELQEMARTDAVRAFRNYYPPDEPSSSWSLEGAREEFESIIKFFDGYPLPIRLAATYMREMRCDLQRLCQQLQIDPLQTLRERGTAESRETSLRASLELSYTALPTGAKEIFPMLALFPGGISQDLANFVLGSESYESFATLLQFSMAELPLDMSTERRYYLPEPARQYALSKSLLKNDGDIELRVLDYFYGKFEQAHNRFDSEPAVEGIGAIIQLERANLAHFLKWGYEHERRGDRVCRSARITAIASESWTKLAPELDLAQSIEAALTASERIGDEAGRADVLKARGDYLLREQGLDAALEVYRQSAQLYELVKEASDDALWTASILFRLGAVQRACLSPGRAIAAYSEAYEVLAGERRELEAARVKIAIAGIREAEGELAEALDGYEEAKQLFLSLRHQRDVARVGSAIARVIARLELEGEDAPVHGRLQPKVFQLRTAEMLRTFEFAAVTPIRRVWKQGYCFVENLGSETGLEMVAVPEGNFEMGSPEGDDEAFSDEKPQYGVGIPSFFLGRYPVTQAQWRFVAGLPKVNRGLALDPSQFKGDRHPVERVSWYEAEEFCERLCTYTGRAYRLPSEAEWEYACRAGTTTKYAFGDDISPEVANYNGNNDGTTPVDRFEIANEFGLSDMHGNVWEWCLDHWHSNYKLGNVPHDGSPWTSQDEHATRVVRGGSWVVNPRICRSAFRLSLNPGDRDDFNLGFRVACAAPRT